MAGAVRDDYLFGAGNDLQGLVGSGYQNGSEM